jgi:serine/threonine protein kinase/Flp pilus assembly protein TadD
MATGPKVAERALESADLARDRRLVLEEFAAAWELGQPPDLEEFLDRLEEGDSREAVALIYRDFCLADANGRNPDAADYLARFPQHRAELERLIWLHGACSPSLLDRWMETTPAIELPDVGDEIGPFALRRELGRGAFARVFLAEQTNLENRLVVLKVSARMTREPWLLARVRHAHIVEIVSHATVDDGAFHLICMPFWGGATLASVFAVRRQRAHKPRSGLDLLADLDSVAAPESPTVHPARAAREILSGLTYPQAVAWIGARLAEALDHAFSREVAHGDVKPSNILLSADGNPMLLDFNLARDRLPAGLSTAVNDPGGTLAYMAPERLQDLMSDCPNQRDWSSGQPQGDAVADEQGNGPHLADIYALGIVLLEALTTGRPPAPAQVTCGPAPETDLGRLRAAASAYARARSRDARQIVRDSEQAARTSIALGLRAILERCLDPDPTRRYRRGLELAEDLDRWRALRPPVYTDEPFWGQTVPRWLRRQRLALLVAALSLVVILATTTVALWQSNQTLQTLGLRKLARHWDDPSARNYGSQRPGSPHFPEPDEPRVFETALRALNDYGVLGPGDWRRRDDVRLLPAPERDELELWLLEQAYRHCRALDDRPESCRRDWQRALDCIKHVTATCPLQAFAILGDRLRGKLGATARPAAPAGAGASEQPGAVPASASPNRSAPPWLEEYMLGVAAESEFGSEPGAESLAADPVPVRRSTNVPAIPDVQTLSHRRAAMRALEHYRRLLLVRPDSYWGNYRAAVSLFALGSYSEAAAHLRRCIARRPNNPMLHMFLAGCMEELQQFPEALEECNEALERAPDEAEWYRSRAFIRAASGQTGGLADDIRYFELLSHILPRNFWNNAPVWGGTVTTKATPPETGEGMLFSQAIATTGRFRPPKDLEHQSTGGGVAAEEIIARARLATRIREAGDQDLASAELAKILILDPDQIAVRITRAVQALEARQFDEAYREFDLALNHPGLSDYVSQKEPALVRLIHRVSRRFCHHGKVDEGLAIARRALELSNALKLFRGESHFNMARACAISAGKEHRLVAEAANQLSQALHFNKDYIILYNREQDFDAVRVQIDIDLGRMLEPDPRQTAPTARGGLTASAVKDR